MGLRIDPVTFPAMQKTSASFTTRPNMNPNDSCISLVLTWFFYMSTDSQRDYLPSLIGNLSVAKRNESYQQQKHTSGTWKGDYAVKTKGKSMFLSNKYLEGFTISEGFGEIVDGDLLREQDDCSKFAQKVLAKNATNVEIIVMIYTEAGNHALGFFHSKKGGNFLFDPNLGQYNFDNQSIATMMKLVIAYYEGTVAIFCQWLPS